MIVNIENENDLKLIQELRDYNWYWRDLRNKNQIRFFKEYPGSLSPKPNEISEGEKDIVYDLIHRVIHIIEESFDSVTLDTVSDLLVNKTMVGYIRNPNTATNLTICRILNTLYLPKIAVVDGDKIKFVSNIEKELVELDQRGHDLLKQLKRTQYLTELASGIRKKDLIAEENRLINEYNKIRKRIKTLNNRGG